MSHSGDITTTQMSHHELVLRFLTRTQTEVAQLRACLPDMPMAIERFAVDHIERMAHKISSAAEAFGFPEIDAIAGAIELMAHDSAGRPLRERVALAMRLNERISALAMYIEHELAENAAAHVPDDPPMSAHLPGFGARQK